jgi:C-terminal peptidase prc
VRIAQLPRLACVALTGAIVAGCNGGGGGGQADTGTTLPCTVAEQRQAVLDFMTEWYFFNDEPAQQQKYENLDLDQFLSPAALLSFLRFGPGQFDRNFSFITTTSADEQFFDEGQFVGFGFGTKLVDPPLNSDLRLTQVFAGSPAEQAGLRRGQQILEINGRTIAAINAFEGLASALGADTEGLTRTFRLRDVDGSEFEVSVAKALVTIDPVPLSRIFDVAGTRVGYLDFRTFVSTADEALDLAFAEFEAQNVTAVIVDVRYNGGGLVSTARLLSNLLGGFIASGQVYSETLFNSAKSSLNAVERFSQRPASLSLLQQVVFITTDSSASASELVINALRPHTVVSLIGNTTFGKPVGQIALGFCDNELLLRPVAFEVVNALGEGQYYDGLSPTCGAADELAVPLGDPTESSLATALAFIETGSCSSVSFQTKPGAPLTRHANIPREPGAPAAERLLGAD